VTVVSQGFGEEGKVQLNVLPCTHKLFLANLVNRRLVVHIDSTLKANGLTVGCDAFVIIVAFVRMVVGLGLLGEEFTF
jgi:hypothetical protein